MAFSPVEHVQLLGNKAVAARWLPFARQKFRALDRGRGKTFFKLLTVKDAVIRLRRIGKVRMILIEGLGLAAGLILHWESGEAGVPDKRYIATNPGLVSGGSPEWKIQRVSGLKKYGDNGWMDGVTAVSWDSVLSESGVLGDGDTGVYSRGRKVWGFADGAEDDNLGLYSRTSSGSFRTTIWCLGAYSPERGVVVAVFFNSFFGDPRSAAIEVVRFAPNEEGVMTYSVLSSAEDFGGSGAIIPSKASQSPLGDQVIFESQKRIIHLPLSAAGWSDLGAALTVTYVSPSERTAIWSSASDATDTRTVTMEGQSFAGAAWEHVAGVDSYSLTMIDIDYQSVEAYVAPDETVSPTTPGTWSLTIDMTATVFGVAMTSHIEMESTYTSGTSTDEIEDNMEFVAATIEHAVCREFYGLRSDLLIVERQDRSTGDTLSLYEGGILKDSVSGRLTSDLFRMPSFVLELGQEDIYDWVKQYNSETETHDDPDATTRTESHFVERSHPDTDVSTDGLRQTINDADISVGHILDVPFVAILALDNTTTINYASGSLGLNDIWPVEGNGYMQPLGPIVPYSD